MLDPPDDGVMPTQNPYVLVPIFCLPVARDEKATDEGTASSTGLAVDCRRLGKSDLSPTTEATKSGQSL
ncbi:MAG: hypothetical protein ACPG4T_19715, partial [Nannocystaceae bacterium]